MGQSILESGHVPIIEEFNKKQSLHNHKQACEKGNVLIH